MIKWSYEKTNTGFSATEQAETLLADLAPAAGTYNHVFAAPYTIAAAGTQTVDFYGPWTTLSGESVTATKIIAVWLKATGNSTLKIEPHSVDPLTWPFKGTAPYVEVKPSTGTGFWAHGDGTHATLSTTVRQWLLTNTGANQLTVTLAAFCGT
jgi:hypothetical protein